MKIICMLCLCHVFPKFHCVVFFLKCDIILTLIIHLSSFVSHILGDTTKHFYTLYNATLQSKQMFPSKTIKVDVWEYCGYLQERAWEVSYGSTKDSVAATCLRSSHYMGDYPQMLALWNSLCKLHRGQLYGQSLVYIATLTGLEKPGEELVTCFGSFLRLMNCLFSWLFKCRYFLTLSLS